VSTPAPVVPASTTSAPIPVTVVSNAPLAIVTPSASTTPALTPPPAPVKVGWHAGTDPQNRLVITSDSLNAPASLSLTEYHDYGRNTVMLAISANNTNFTL